MSRLPQTYQGWMDCFARLEEHPWDKETLELVRRGSYMGKPSEQFLARLSDTVSRMLSGCTRRFLRDLDNALADNEPDMVPLLAARLRRAIRGCLFYRELAFLDRSYVRTLDAGFSGQLNSFWKDLLRQLFRAVRESGDPRLEDVVTQLRRMEIVEKSAEAEHE